MIDQSVIVSALAGLYERVSLEWREFGEPLPYRLGTCFFIRWQKRLGLTLGQVIQLDVDKRMVVVPIRRGGQQLFLRSAWESWTKEKQAYYKDTGNHKVYDMTQKILSTKVVDKDLSSG